MCGIVAVLHFDLQYQVSEPMLRQMDKSMVHLGPDDEVYWIRGPIGLGHRRLAIIDLSSTEHQPMRNEDGTLWITYNGEIYNFLELRQELEKKGHSFRSHTDTETILHAYEEWGTECLSHFNRMWVFALWDDPQKHLFVARDRLSIKPLVYYQDAQRFISASEIKRILSSQTLPRDIDREALHHYFSLMNIPAPFTIYKAIRKRNSGYYLLVETGHIEDHLYWNLPMGEEIRDDDSKILEALDNKINESAFQLWLQSIQ